MQIIVDGLLTDYLDLGKGKTLVFLHGWGDNKETFSELMKDLQTKYRVVSLDLPGFGKSDAPKISWGLENYAHFLSLFLRKINIKEIYAVIAHSNGGAVAIKALDTNEYQANKLILLASAGIRDHQKGKRLFIKVVAKTGKLLTFWLPLSSKQKLQERLYGTIGSDMLKVPHMKETFKNTVRQDVQVNAQRLTAHTLLIYGSQDRATPPIYGEIFHNLIPGSTLKIINNAGHFVHHDQPRVLANLIEEFLA